jgi:hypothetical protein
MSNETRFLGLLSQDPDLYRRAMAAYYRSGYNSDDGLPDGASYLVDHDERRYIVLANSRLILAVYRIRQSGLLKRLRRWPKEIEDGAT